jgi:Ankyrin repeats (3 copies)
MAELSHADCENPPTVAPLDFAQPNEESVAAYTKEVVDALRTERVDELRRLHEAGYQLQCSNRFGESILHMACRRSLTDVVRFLVQDAKVSVLVRDDFGRTALHFAFWTPTPNFDLVRLLVEQVPELLCVEDVRGSTPLQYIRNEHRDQWYNFFVEHRALLHPRCNASKLLGQGPEDETPPRRVPEMDQS